MNIYLYHPSRGRPEQAQLAYSTWLSLADDLDQIHHVQSCDRDDKTLEQYLSHPDSTELLNDNKTMVEALNRCLQPEHEGIIITLYDDMIPSAGWDTVLREAYQPGKLLRIDCGVPLQTVCAGCASVFQRWGYVYYPGYISMFADNDYQEHGEHENLFVDCAMMITHNHPAHGTAKTDATYQRQNHPAAYRLGEQVLTRRRKVQFYF